MLLGNFSCSSGWRRKSRDHKQADKIRICLGVAVELLYERMVRRGASLQDLFCGLNEKQEKPVCPTFYDTVKEICRLSVYSMTLYLFVRVMLLLIKIIYVKE